jgi:hypothetical protein
MFTLLIIFKIVGGVAEHLVNSVLSFLPTRVFFVLYNICESIYIIAVLVLGLIILLHIFKTRYLDYYEIVREDNFDKEKEEVSEENKKDKEGSNKISVENKKEKIIIRDSNHSGYKFMSGLLSFFLFIIKVIVVCCGIGFCFSLVGLVFMTVISFVIIKTGTLFVGILIVLLSSITINLIILDVIYNFIFNRKVKKGKIAITFLISLIFIGIGAAIATIGISNIDHVTDINDEKYFTTTSITRQMKDNLVIDDSNDINYVVSDNEDLIIEYRHSKYYDLYLNEYEYNNSSILCMNIVLQDDVTDVKLMKVYINDIKDMKLVNYYESKITIYTTQENINKLKENFSKYD